MPPIDKLTMAPASAVPAIAEVCSALLMTLSVATAPMVGADGAVKSTLTVFNADAALALPAWSVTTTLRLWVPSVRASSLATVRSL